MAQDGDARYLALEILSGTISTAADIFSLGMTALELVSNYDMPVNGDLWTNIRELKIPTKITSSSYFCSLFVCFFFAKFRDHII